MDSYGSLKELMGKISSSDIQIKNQPERSLQVIESEINIYKQQTAIGMIEIGKRLIEAKEMVTHGEWGKWLDKIEFSQRTANRFMQVAYEFSNSSALTNLGQTKIFLLLDLPTNERDEFIENNDIENMTTRELQTAIKAMKQAEQEAAMLKAKLQEEQQARETADKKISQLTNNTAYLQERLQEKDEAMKQLVLNQPEPQVTVKEVIVEKEVLPVDYQETKIMYERLKEKEAKARDDANKFKLEAEGYKKHIETFQGGTKSFEAASLIDFKFAVRNFLKEVTPLIYMGEHFSGMKANDIQKFQDELQAIERWVMDFGHALSGKAGGANHIVIEGGIHYVE